MRDTPKSLQHQWECTRHQRLLHINSVVYWLSYSVLDNKLCCICTFIRSFVMFTYYIWSDRGPVFLIHSQNGNDSFVFSCMIYTTVHRLEVSALADNDVICATYSLCTSSDPSTRMTGFQDERRYDLCFMGMDGIYCYCQI